VEQALPHFATVAQQLDTAADAIAKANAEVHHVVEEIAATALIGIGLSVLTAGFSDVVAAGAAEAEVAEAAGEVTRLGQLLIRVAEVMERIKTAMEDSKLLKFGVEFGKNLDANSLGSVSGQVATGPRGCLRRVRSGRRRPGRIRPGRPGGPRSGLRTTRPGK
jgi:hypothetical protein